MIRLKLGSLFVALALILGACAASEPPNPFIGEWTLTISSPVGEMASDLVVNPDLTGTMSSDDLGSASLDDIVVNDNTLSFSTTIDAQGQILTLVFNGTIAEDSFSGSFDTDFGAIPASGVRK